MCKINRLAPSGPLFDRLHRGEVVGDHSLAVIARRATIAQHLLSDLAAGVRAFQLARLNGFVHQSALQPASTHCVGHQGLVGQDVRLLRLIELVQDLYQRADVAEPERLAATPAQRECL